MEAVNPHLRRKIDYLRISVTDRCNMRCMYCIPEEGIHLKPHEEILSFEETLRLVKIFVSLGVRKIRLTGGEPLVRKGIVDLVGSITQVEGVDEVSLTTNGILLPDFCERLKSSGIKRINVSLDTLNSETFKRITRNDCIDKVIDGITAAKDLGFDPIKINTVIMRGINDGEITDFVEFAVTHDLTLRFIEFMNVTPLWKEKYYFPVEEIKNVCEKRFELSKIGRIGSGPADYYEVNGSTLVGFIRTDENNCRICNRLRLTSCGELKVCLYEDKGVLLKELLRRDATNDQIRDVIAARLGIKREVDHRNYSHQEAYMCSIGG